MRPRDVLPEGSLDRLSDAVWVLSAACLVGCASVPHAQFQGVAAPPVMAAKDLQQHDYVAHDHLAIGKVSASCQHDTDEDDDRCSELILLRSMREQAARSGGTAFVAPSCHYGTTSPSLQRIECTATVARRRSLLPATAEAADASAAQERQWEVRIEGDDVRITARPAPGVVPKPHTRRVRRAWAEDASAKRRGTVQAECVERCERALVERGLEQGAAWIGSDEISQVECHEVQAGRWLCSGEAVSLSP